MVSPHNEGAECGFANALLKRLSWISIMRPHLTYTPFTQAHFI